MLSSAWKYVPGNEYCVKVTDGTHDSPKQAECGKPLITSKHIKGDVIDFDTAYLISEHDFNEINKRSKVDQWDVIISMIGAYCGFCFIESNEEIEYAVKNVGLFKAGTEVNAKWLYYYLNSPIGRAHLDAVKSGSTQPYIALGALRNLPILVPKEDDVKEKIVAILDAIDTKIRVNNRINAELEAMAKTLYDYWFVQFDFPDANGKPYKTSGGTLVYSPTLKREIPAGWEVKKLSEIAVTGSGGTPLSSNPEFYENGTIPWINSGELNAQFIVSTANFITELGLEKSSAKLFSKNTILMAMYGATAGKVSFIDFPAATNQAICAINPFDQEMNVYLKFTLERLYEYLINLSSGSARDNLSQDKIKSLDMVIPAQSTLTQFHEFTKSKMDLILTNLKENQDLASLRDWLLPMLMNGQVTVGEAN